MRNCPARWPASRLRWTAIANRCRKSTQRHPLSPPKPSPRQPPTISCPGLGLLKPRREQRLTRPRGHHHHRRLFPTNRPKAPRRPFTGKPLEAYRAGALENATTLFEDFYKQHPQHPLADNALYWAGECQYARKRYLKAIDTFKSVLEQYPNGGKVPDALLKTGFSYLALGDKTTGRHYLQHVIRQYPFSPAGAKAEERLSVIR